MADRRIATHCLKGAESAIDPSAAPSPREARRAFEVAAAFIALAERKPTAPFGPGQDLRLFLSDVIENIEGSNCDPRMIAVLERGLAGIPPA